MARASDDAPDDEKSRVGSASDKADHDARDDMASKDSLAQQSLNTDLDVDDHGVAAGLSANPTSPTPSSEVSSPQDSSQPQDTSNSFPLHMNSRLIPPRFRRWVYCLTT